MAHLYEINIPRASVFVKQNRSKAIGREQNVFWRWPDLIAGTCYVELLNKRAADCIQYSASVYVYLYQRVQLWWWQYVTSAGRLWWPDLL